MTNLNEKTPCFIDIHLHLDGSISVQTARRLAEMQGIAVPESDEALLAMLSYTPDCKTLDDYLARFDFACSLLHNREALTIAAHDLLQRLKEQGLIYAEIRFAPQKSCGKNMTQRDAIEAVIEGLRSVDMLSGLIVCMMRGTDTAAANIETVSLAEEYLGKGVVGIDLAGPEAMFPTHEYADLLAMIHDKHIPVTVHAGEGRGADSVAETIELGVTRLGHGVRALEDETVVELLLEKNVTLDICPTSNIHTHIFPSYSAFPLREFLRRGINVTLNTDNMTVSGVTLRDEWERMCELNQLTTAEIRRILLNAVDACFASAETKQTLRRQVLDAYPSVYVLEIGDISEAECDGYLAQLPKWRREKALKFKHFQGRKECVMSFVLLQKALKEEFCIDCQNLAEGVEALAFEYGEHDKPSLKNFPDIHFNISHCKQAVACVVANHPVGIDIESRGRYSAAVSSNVLNAVELATLHRADDIDAAFTALWTKKEALLKLLGSGVSHEMKDVLLEHKDKKITTTECDGYVYSFAE